MQFTYKAQKQDFETINQAVNLIYSNQLNNIFNDKKIFENITIISFDSELIYIWSKLQLKKFKKLNSNLNPFNLYTIKHKYNIKPQDRIGWKSGLYIEDFKKILPYELTEFSFENPVISGSLMGDFIYNQKLLSNKTNNPYVTRESYIATIIHEVAHIYYQQRKNWWFSNKKKNIEILKLSLSLYEKDKNMIKNNDLNLEIPKPLIFSEIFAFCCEYYTSGIFLKNHQENLDKFIISVIKKSINVERIKNLNREDSCLSEKSPHILAFTLGKIIIQKYPNNWPLKLLQQSIF